MELVKYDAACRAVAECRTVDEAQEIRNRAEALRAYAKQAKNRQLEIDASEIRIRAERKTGEILLELQSESKIAGTGRPEKGSREGMVRRADLGIDGALSATAQRLAKLPSQRFETEIAEWRASAFQADRLTTPLQKYRIPSRKADTQTAAARAGRHRIDASDPFDRFRNIDGRRIADWRIGELGRLEQLATRMAKCAAMLRSALPVANADPLDTVEMLFNEVELLSILNEAWIECKVGIGDAGLTNAAQQRRTQNSLQKRARKCRCCGKDFVMCRAPRQSRPYEGQYCSRQCAAKA